MKLNTIRSRLHVIGDVKHIYSAFQCPNSKFSWYYSERMRPKKDSIIWLSHSNFPCAPLEWAHVCLCTLQ